MKTLIIASLLGAFFLIGCGVKGDPQPPTVPADIGRGQPSYRRALKEVNLPQIIQDEEDNANEEK